MNANRLTWTLCAAMAVGVAAPPPRAWAQSPPPATAGFQDGFFLQSADGNNRLSIGLIAHIDGRFSLDEPPPVISTFALRRMRPVFAGRVARFFEFRLIPDFGNGNAIVQDAFLDVRLSSSVRVRVGKDKAPVGYEMLILAPRLLFAERSLASSLVPNRDIGVQALGDVAGGKVSYAAGVFNGIPDGSNSTVDQDTNGAKDFAGRLVVRPFSRGTPQNPQPLDGLGVHLGGSTGRQAGPLPTFRTSVLQSYFSYANGVSATGRRNRVAPALFYYYRSFGGFAEYTRSTQQVARNGISTDVTNRAWDVTASYLLTGETATTGILRPRNNFDPEAGHWGAWQVAVRYAALTIDRAVLDAGLAAAGASREARAFAIATNWYPNPYIKYVVMFERTVFNGNVTGARAPENVIVVRSQVAF